jgi:hypothetical protein
MRVVVISSLTFNLLSIVGVPNCVLARDGERQQSVTDGPAVVSLLFAVLLSFRLLTPQDFCGGAISLAHNFL